MKKTIFFALVAIVMLSCTPKSAMMTKAVILGEHPRASDSQTHYVVYIPSYGIKDHFISYYSHHEIGDTILIHDKWRNYEIK